MNLNDPRALLAHVNQYSPDLLAGLAALPLDLGTDDPVFNLHRLAVHLTDHNRTHSERTPAPGPDAEALAAMDAYLLHRYECVLILRRATAAASRAADDLRDIPELLEIVATRNFADEGPMPPFVSYLMSAKTEVATARRRSIDAALLLPDTNPPDIYPRFRTTLDRLAIRDAYRRIEPIARELRDVAEDLQTIRHNAWAAVAIGERTRRKLSNLYACINEANISASKAARNLETAAKEGKFQITP